MLQLLFPSGWMPFLIGGLLIGVGVSQQIYMSLNNTLIQESVDDAYRGRVLSTMFLNRGMVPLGAMIAGFGASLVGAPLTIGVMAAIMLLMGLGALRSLSQPTV